MNDFQLSVLWSVAAGALSCADALLGSVLIGTGKSRFIGALCLGAGAYGLGFAVNDLIDTLIYEDPSAPVITK